MSNQEDQPSLAGLQVEEKVILDFIFSSKVKVPTVLLPVAKVLATDIILAAVIAADLPEGADLTGALKLLTTYKQPQIQLSLTELRDSLVDMALDEFSQTFNPATDQEKAQRVETVRYFFSDEFVREQLETS